jgi:hypothetical protein
LQHLQPVPGCVWVLHKPCAYSNSTTADKQQQRFAIEQIQLHVMPVLASIHGGMRWFCLTDLAGSQSFTCCVVAACTGFVPGFVHKPCACDNNTTTSTQQQTPAWKLHELQRIPVDICICIQMCQVGQRVRAGCTCLTACLHVLSCCTNPVHTATNTTPCRELPVCASSCTTYVRRPV